MRLGGFTAITWRPGDTEAAARAAQFALRVDASRQWRTAREGDCLRLWVWGAAPLAVTLLPQGAGVVVGDLFSAPAAGAPQDLLSGVDATQRDVLGVAQWLSRHRWGRYIALLRDQDGCAAVFRDPSGLIDCLIWRLESGVTVIASEFDPLPDWLRPQRLSLNWDSIAHYVAIPSARSTEPLFDDVVAVGPGELRRLEPVSMPSTLVWRPADFATPAAADTPVLQAELVRRVDVCTAQLASTHDRLIVELSGGLDSSILAGALAATGHAGRVAVWLNRVGDRAEGDERDYARAVTDRIGVRLTTVAKPFAPLIASDFAELARSVWPAMNGVDASRDRDEVERLTQMGARGLISGQGGDALFFQHPTPLVVADALRAKGLSVLASPLLGDVARRTRQSVWRVLAAVRADRRGRRPPLMAPSSLMRPEIRALAAGSVHRWTADAQAQGLPPAKTVQILGLANHHIYHGDSRRRGVADLIFPLLSQPVMEHCLSIPIPVLASTSEDRPFAREAFAARLPAAVRARREKGNLSAYFARLVAVSLPTLRPMLLDGCLCEAGILDRDAVNRVLDPRQLIWESRPADILWAASVEAWARHWQSQVPDSPSAPRLRR